MKKRQMVMKKASLVIMLFLSITISYAQEMKTLFSKDTSKAQSFGGYGAPFVGATSIDKKDAVIVGGKGGVIKNHSFVFGLLGTAVIGTTSVSGSNILTDIAGNDSLGKPFNQKVSMGYGGVFFEHIFDYSSPIHISIPVNFQIGGVLGGRDNSTFKIKTSTVFVVEPGLCFEFNFYKFFVPSVNIGYRYVTGDYSANLSGIYGSLICKFGHF